MSSIKRKCDQINELELYTKKLKLTQDKQSHIKFETNQLNKFMKDIHQIIKNQNNKLNEINVKLDKLSTKLTSLTENYNNLSNNMILPPKNNYHLLYIS